jgi:hypothetical protein
VGLVLACVGIWALYLVVANVLLATGGLSRLVNASQGNVVMHYRKAWTIRPGRVHVEGFDLRIEDGAVQAWLRVSRATVDIDLMALFEREFYAKRVDAADCSFWLRRRMPVLEFEPRRLRGLPPIPGVVDPPLQPPPKISGEPPDNWRVRFGLVGTRLVDLWIDHHRFSGNAVLFGSLDFLPEESIHVSAAGAVLAGHVFAFDRLLASRLEGVFGGELATVDLRVDDPAPQLVDNAAVAGSIHSLVPDLGVLAEYGGMAFVPRGGRAELRGGIHVARGSLGPATRLKLSLGAARTEHDDKVLSVSGEAVLAARAPGVRLDADLVGTLGTRADPDAITVKTAELQAQTRAARLPDFGGLERAKASLGLQAALPRLQRAFLGFERDDPRFEAGNAVLDARLRFREGAPLEARLRLASPEAVLRWGETRFRAAVDASSRLVADAEALRAPETRLRITRLSHGKEPEAAGDWWGHVVVRDLEVRHGKGWRLRLGARATLRDARPLLALPPIDDAVPGIVAALIDVDDARLDAGLFVADGLTELKLHCGDSDGVALRGRLLMAKESFGAFILTSGPLRLGIAIGGGKTSLRWFPGDDFGRAHLERLGPSRGCETPSG